MPGLQRHQPPQSLEEQQTDVAQRPRDNPILREKGRTQSAQHVELIAIVLAIRKSLKENQSTIYIFTDSWAVALWLRKWQRNDSKINAKDIWSREYWEELYIASEKIKICYTCVST